MADIECTRCNDTGVITRRAIFPMSYVCAGSPPDDARGVVEARCDVCNPVQRWHDETDGLDDWDDDNDMPEARRQIANEAQG